MCLEMFTCASTAAADENARIVIENRIDGGRCSNDDVDRLF
jgi:hypothetical protein